MRYIKKIGVTPMAKNEGKIIDSFDTSDDKHINAPSLQAVINRTTTVANNVTAYCQFLDGIVEQNAKTYTDGQVSAAKSYADGLINPVHYTNSYHTQMFPGHSGTGIDKDIIVVVDLYKTGKILCGNIDLFSGYGSEVITTPSVTSDTINISDLLIPSTKIAGYVGQYVNIATDEQYIVEIDNTGNVLSSLTVRVLFNSVTPQSNGHFATIPISVVLN